jgi:hypothetical protein
MSLLSDKTRYRLALHCEESCPIAVGTKMLIKPLRLPTEVKNLYS